METGAPGLIGRRAVAVVVKDLHTGGEHAQTHGRHLMETPALEIQPNIICVL